METTIRLNNGLSSTQLTSSSTTKPLQQSHISSTGGQTTTHISNDRPYTKWQGNNTICCKGRIIGGPQKRNFFITLSLILFPSIFFIGFVSINYIKYYSNYYVLIIYVLLLLISLLTFTLTAFIDPGIIPRGILSETINYKGPIHLKQRMCISGKLIEIKWCGTCHIFRPPRSFHCYICNNCVERFDHHCPWVGNCIGIRNYAYFTIFINSLQLLCFWALFHCIYILYLRTNEKPNISHWKQFIYALKYEYMALGTGIYVFIGMWFVIGLTWFHWFLVFLGKTTNEQLRNLHPAGSPFKRSLMGNIIDHCCQFPPTAINLHSITPKASYNELFINKSKVILLNNDQVEQHHKQIHSYHINNNSPFKTCLINNNNKSIIPCVGGINNKIKINGMDDNNNNNLLNKSPAFKFIQHKNGKNKTGLNLNKNNKNNKNGKSLIQMTHFNNNKHNRNGYYKGHNTIETDNKIEEEENCIEMIHNTNENENEEKKNNNISKYTQIVIHTYDNNDNNDNNENEKEEENKYSEHTNANGMNDKNNQNMNEISVSKSRKDENCDQENLYISYDESDENDEKLHATQYQYSRSVTPNPGNVCNSIGNKSMTPTPNIMPNMPNNNLFIRKNNRTLSNASKISIPSESPGSDHW